MFEKELLLAQGLAVQVGDIQLSYQNTLEVEWKSDASPVTQADQESEKILREAIHQSFPDDGFIGEEFGKEEGKNQRYWILDPIDGTRPFIRGIPTHSVLIALEENGEMVMGLMHFPAMNKTYWATKGGGAFLNHRPIEVSKTAALNKATGAQLGLYEKDEPAKKLLSLGQKANYIYGYMDAWSYGLLAEGRLDFTANSMDKIWDCAPAICIVGEAGGHFIDWQGGNNPHGVGSIFCTKALETEIRQVLFD